MKLKIKNYLVYKIRNIETGKFVCTQSGEHCETITEEWAQIIESNYKILYPNDKLEIITEKKYVKYRSS